MSTHSYKSSGFARPHAARPMPASVTSSDGIAEVRLFLTGLGLGHCTDAVVDEGFYTSVDALKVATYDGLLECGITPAQS